MPIPPHIHRKIAPFIWPFIWVSLGLCGALGLEELARYNLQKELEDKGAKAYTLTQAWQQKLGDITQELATDERLLAQVSDELSERNSEEIKRALYEFTYLRGLENVYFFTSQKPYFLSFPYTSLRPTEELVELWRNMANSAEYAAVQTHFIELVGQTGDKSPFIMSFVPLFHPRTQVPMGGVCILFSLGEAAARHPQPAPTWFEHAKAFLVDETAGQYGLMYGPMWKGGQRNLPTFSLPLSRQERRILRAKYGQITFNVGKGEGASASEEGIPQSFSSLPLRQEGLRLVLLVPQSTMYQKIRPLQLGSVGAGFVLALLAVLWRWWAKYQAEQRALALKRVKKVKESEDLYSRHVRYVPPKELKYGAKKPPILEKKPEKSPDKIMMETILESLDKNRTTLLFQPIFISGATTPSMYEVLLRIQDDIGKTITPAQFVPIANKFNLFPNIDIHVVMRVIGEYLQYNRAHQLPLSVNLGPETFESKVFLQTLIQRLDPEWSNKLIFEVRSEDVIKNKHALDFMKQARNLGCKFSSDYFGGGEAMLKGASKMNFTFVKLDAQKFQTAEKRKELIRLAEKAQDLGLVLVLERIEERTDALLASKLQIPLVQGYYFGKPKESM